MSNLIQEPSRAIPVAAEADVVIVGGGIAGAAAALEAARNNARTLLIERGCVLGGLATAGLVVYYLPLCDGYGRQVIGGIGEELLKRSLKFGVVDAEAQRIPDAWTHEASTEERAAHRYAVRFDAAPMALTLEEALLEAGVRIWYDTRLCACTVEDARVHEVIVENKSGRLALRAGAFVDASGDADLCWMAGENTVSDDQNRRSGWYFGVRDGVIQLRAITDPLNGPCPEGSRFYRGDTGADVSQNLLDAHRMMLDDAKKQSVTPFLIPSIPLFRMTRRLASVKDITPEMCGVTLPDAVGYTGDWRRASPAYPIPFASLYGERISNLLAAGRCMGSVGDAWDVLRVIPPCAVTGQAAGLAAARLSQTPRARVQEMDVQALRGELLARGVIL